VHATTDPAKVGFEFVEHRVVAVRADNRATATREVSAGTALPGQFHHLNLARRQLVNRPPLFKVLVDALAESFWVAGQKRLSRLTGHRSATAHRTNYGRLTAIETTADVIMKHLRWLARLSRVCL
jgi:hypothetical protein